jgi:hypothetical protein
LSNATSIAWQWTTNVWLGAAADAGGWVQGAERWAPLGSTADVSGVTDAHYDFAGWSGDVGAADTNLPGLSLPMDWARNVAAHFRAQTAARGTPRWWLAAYYGDGGDFDALEEDDADVDSMAAWQEYIAGTAPTDRDSALRVTEIRREGSGVELGWPGAPARLYGVYRIESMLGGPVTPLDTNIAADPLGLTRYTDSAATNGAPCYLYRLGVRLAP